MALQHRKVIISMFKEGLSGKINKRVIKSAFSEYLQSTSVGLPQMTTEEIMKMSQ